MEHPHDEVVVRCEDGVVVQQLKRVDGRGTSVALLLGGRVPVMVLRVYELRHQIACHINQSL